MDNSLTYCCTINVKIDAQYKVVSHLLVLLKTSLNSSCCSLKHHRLSSHHKICMQITDARSGISQHTSVTHHTHTHTCAESHTHACQAIYTRVPPRKTIIQTKCIITRVPAAFAVTHNTHKHTANIRQYICDRERIRAHNKTGA